MENETVDRKALGNSLLESLREDGYREANIVYQQTLALLSECSRLASRVEELESENKILRDGYERVGVMLAQFIGKVRPQ